jgi:hypothetical protein
MSRSKPLLFILFIVVLLILSSIALTGAFVYPYGRVKPSPVPKYTVMDLTGVMAGLRRLGADIAWVQLLQYYGTQETPLDKDTEYQVSVDMVKHLLGKNDFEKELCLDNNCTNKNHYHPNLEGGVYPELYRYCQRVIQLDPFFNFAYLYGAATLGWNLNRPDEALELLKTGIANMESYRSDITKDVHQPYWQLHLYLGALSYAKTGEFDKMRGLLETAAVQPECPNMVKVLLANIYQKEAKFMPSLKLWLEVYDSGDLSYRQRSSEKINELGKLVNLTPK